MLCVLSGKQTGRCHEGERCASSGLVAAMSFAPMTSRHRLLVVAFIAMQLAGIDQAAAQQNQENLSQPDLLRANNISDSAGFAAAATLPTSAPYRLGPGRLADAGS